MVSKSAHAARWLIGAALLLSLFPLTAAGAQPDSAWRFYTDSTFAYWRFDAQYVAGRIFVLGGRLSDGTTDGSIWAFQVGLPGSWHDTRQTLNIPVSNYIIAPLTDAHGLGLYVIGGRADPGVAVPDVQIYYPQANRVITDFTDPFPGRDPSGNQTYPGSVAVAGNKAYAIGGASISGTSIVDVTNEVWVYDPSQPEGSRWTAGPRISLARAYIASTVVGDRFIYAIGGDTWVNPNLVAQPIVEVLDTQHMERGWQQRAPLPMPSSGTPGCDENQAYTIDTTIYLAGCGQWPNELADSFQYDVQNNTWAPYDPLNQARRNFAGAFIEQGGRSVMYVLGGRQGSDTGILTSSEINLGGSAGAPARPNPAAPAAGPAGTN